MESFLLSAALEGPYGEGGPGKAQGGGPGWEGPGGPGWGARERWPRRGPGGLGTGPSGPYVPSVCLIIAAIICFFSCCLVFFGCCHCYFCLMSLVLAAKGPRAQEPGDQGPWGPGKSPGINEGEPRGPGRPPSNEKKTYKSLQVKKRALQRASK